MKKVEVWCYETYPAVLAGCEGIVRKIYLDAMKEGMRRGANKIKSEDETNDCSSCRRYLKNVEQSILIEADQLTEKEL